MMGSVWTRRVLASADWHGHLYSLYPFLRGEGWGEGLPQHRDSRRVPLTRAFGATSPRKRGEVKDLLHVRDVIGQLRNLLRRHRPHHVGHGAVIAVAGIVLVFGQGLGEVI